jgi:hypothetical protein
LSHWFLHRGDGEIVPELGLRQLGSGQLVAGGRSTARAGRTQLGNLTNLASWTPTVGVGEHAANEGEPSAPRFQEVRGLARPVLDEDDHGLVDGGGEIGVWSVGSHAAMVPGPAARRVT